MKEIKAYETSDGKIFGNKAEAARHETDIYLEEWYAMFPITTTIKEISKDAIPLACSIFKNWLEDRGIFFDFIKLIEKEN